MGGKEGTMRILVVIAVGLGLGIGGPCSGAAQTWAARADVDLSGGWDGPTHRTAHIRVTLSHEVEERSAGGFTFALPSVACGLDAGLRRVCEPVVVERVRAGGVETPHHFGSGLLKVKLPALARPGDIVEIELTYTYPAFGRGSGVVGLGGGAGWMPRGERPFGDVALRVTTEAEERGVASGVVAREEQEGSQRVTVWERVDGDRPALLVGPFGPTAPLVAGAADMTLTLRTALEPELEAVVREAVAAHVSTGGTPARPLQLVVAPYLRGDAGAPLVGPAGAFGAGVILLHSPHPTPAFDVQRRDRLFPIPSREVRSTEEVIRAGLAASWRHNVRVTGEARDAWIRGFLDEALDDRPPFSDPWSAPAGLLRRDHGALWPGDEIPPPPDLEGLGRYLAQLVRLRVGDDAFEASLARAVAAATAQPLSTEVFLDAWNEHVDDPALVKTFADVLAVEERAFVELTWSSREVGEDGQGGGHDAEILSTLHGGHAGPLAVHLGLLTTTGEVRQLWTLAEGGPSRLEVEGLPAPLAEVFVIRDGLAVGVTSTDVIPP